MTASMSQEAVFSIFGAICLLGVLFIRTCVPETRGHTLEEIEKLGKVDKLRGKVLKLDLLRFGAELKEAIPE